ncbi:hypothetical protein [Nesterenkonia alba]|uniref:hypothetical protein n=1 Tax=Nesterenkonia alba TaxID=515814 RepID=UPI0003B539A3|nr:hypothetical protein [Nesterenkonia alba]
MKVHPADEPGTLIVRRAEWGVIPFGIVFMAISGVVGFGLTLAFWEETPWIVVVPVAFLLIGAGVCMTANSTRVTLRRYGPSTRVRRTWCFMRRREETFDVSGAQFVGLHTDLRVFRGSVGGGRRRRRGSSSERISTVYLHFPDGREVELIQARAGGWRGVQPYVRAAEQIAGFLNLPLERTGFGAPGEGMNIGGVAGPMGPHSFPR